MIIIRKMKIEDVDSVFAIEYGAHLDPWGLDIFYNCVLAGFDCRVLELFEGLSAQGRVVGFLVCKYDEQNCHLLNLCVDKDMQGQGFGRYLMDDLISSLEKNTTTILLLEVRPSNKVAIALYNTLGFEFVRVKERYYDDLQGNKEDALVLRKVIKK